jgi:polysaccharide biosynthesis/export protein
LSLLGNTPLGGLTEEQAAETIARQLRDRNFLVHPQVKVAIKQSALQGVTVLGEVQHPGVYQISVPRTLLDVLSLAGGLTNTADPKITIKHRSGVENTVTVSFTGDDARASLALNGEVYPGDLIVVPRAGIVYVLGEVGRPGGFVMQDNGKMTLLQALAEAGSTLPTASSSNAVLLRKLDEKLTVSKVRVDKIERGKESDVELHANDILFIPNDRLKSALRNSGTIASTAAMVSTVAIYGVIH